MTQQPSSTVENTASSMSSGSASDVDEPSLTIYLRDINKEMVKAWKEAFKDKKYAKSINASMVKNLPMNFTCDAVHIQISEGDIFKGGPPADAIVSKMTVHSASLSTYILTT